MEFFDDGKYTSQAVTPEFGAVGCGDGGADTGPTEFDNLFGGPKRIIILCRDLLERTELHRRDAQRRICGERSAAFERVRAVRKSGDRLFRLEQSGAALDGHRTAQLAGCPHHISAVGSDVLDDRG